MALVVEAWLEILSGVVAIFRASEGKPLGGPIFHVKPAAGMAEYVDNQGWKKTIWLRGKMDNCSRVRDFIVQNFLFGDEAILKEDTSFLDEGIIDSTGILELIFYLEETFGVKVEDDELVPENMDNLRSITAYLDRKLKGEPAEEV